ncbi:hypothetical protein TFUB4_02013 [Tannerella forsythia]|nr:hypothetical protein TFUB4_00456 [Tannerella forsythia]SCQ20973.1 hypothetical protein TFUB4_01458 [Tannerella forsythia]SCQ21628.1 hypothetical protein TFUB4_01725 [Tannerella forsythia]SCQ22336.1 hypothetical protein TFUB4_02013 [Tannerella forsythia]
MALSVVVSAIIVKIVIIVILFNRNLIQNQLLLVD